MNFVFSGFCAPSKPLSPEAFRCGLRPMWTCSRVTRKNSDMAKQRQPRATRTQTAGPPPQRPQLAESGGRFLQLERETEQEFRPQLLQALQGKVDCFQDPALEEAPSCPGCGQAMGHHDTRGVWWLTRFGRIHASAPRYRCRPCHRERRPLLEVLGVEPAASAGRWPGFWRC